MLRFAGTGPVGRVIGIGLTENDLNCLRDGKPLAADLQFLTGQEGRVIVFYGEKAVNVVEKLKEWADFDPAIEVRTEPEGASAALAAEMKNG